MKKLTILLCLFVSISLTTFAQKSKTQVGVFENGRALLTIDKSNVLKVYNENLLKYSQIDAKFNDVSLLAIEGGNYALVFTSENCKSSFFVSNENGRLMAGNTTSCTTTDRACSKESLGCVPMYANPTDLYGYCSDCASGGTCTKTTSSSSLID